MEAQGGSCAYFYLRLKFAKIIVDKNKAMFEKGNELSKGVSAGKTGRKSAWEEKQDANFISDVWEHAQDVEKLEEKIRSKKYSGREVTALRLLKGSERLMAKFMDKLVPDKLDVTSAGKPIPILEFISHVPSNNSNKKDTGTEETD